MNKTAAIRLLAEQGWTKADAGRALESVDFAADPDELMIWRSASLFAGPELKTRQRLQAAQKGLVTRKVGEIEQTKQEKSEIETQAKRLASENSELEAVSNQLKADNKALKNLLDSIKLRLAIDVKQLMNYKDSEIRQALAKWYKGSQGG
jgi:septal ring factor EnvC (AmiA/AmiB activator)